MEIMGQKPVHSTLTYRIILEETELYHIIIF